MDEHTLAACEALDAAIFTGDVLYQGPEAVALFSQYLARWQRALDASIAEEV